jgi:hypothetical protein
LNIRFTRLFKLSIDKNILVAEMCRWGWGDEGGGWRWVAVEEMFACVGGRVGYGVWCRAGKYVVC